MLPYGYLVANESPLQTKASKPSSCIKELQRPYWSGFPIVGRQLHTTQHLRKKFTSEGPTLCFLPQKNALDSDVVPVDLLYYAITGLYIALIAEKALMPGFKPHSTHPLDNSLALEAR